ncbi:MAG: gamma-glutamylcyclotransferase [Polaromonas sp.]|nr:gamma-glutamylcyclotransferase [Polaromonas sp.]
MPQPSPRYVFVYGTLRKGEERDINRMRPAPRWIGRGSVAGVMHHLGRYPGLVLGGEGSVHGEVYAVEAELERVLDEIEEVWPQQTGEYAKREVAVLLDAPGASSGPGDAVRELVCLLYEIAPEHTQGKPIIASGDWVEHLRNRES